MARVRGRRAECGGTRHTQHGHAALVIVKHLDVVLVVLSR